VAYNFQTEKNIKLPMEYENVLRTLQCCPIKLFELHFLFRKLFHIVISDLKIRGYENPDSNLESLCTMCVCYVIPMAC
jgi:hypothetical protein